MTPRCSFQRLDDNSWGVRLDAFRDAHTWGGKEVDVRKYDGSTKRVTLGAVVTSWNGGRTSVYRIAKTSARAVRDEPRRRESVAAGGVKVLAPLAPRASGPPDDYSGNGDYQSPEQYEIDEAERRMHEIEAQGDREGTIRDEIAKHEARRAMEGGY